MAKKKSAEPVVTLKRDVMANGNIKLTSPKGIVDTRSGAVHTRVICKPEFERFFAEADIEA